VRAHGAACASIGEPGRPPPTGNMRCWAGGVKWSSGGSLIPAFERLLAMSRSTRPTLKISSRVGVVAASERAVGYIGRRSTHKLSRTPESPLKPLDLIFCRCYQSLRALTGRLVIAYRGI
jgi:hypothetical protein